MITAGQIRAARSLLGAKQSDLAKASGISLATINNIERGIGDPRTSTLQAIETALQDAGVEISENSLAKTITLNILYRPKISDTFSASQKILELLGPNPLNVVEQIIFFVRRDSEGGHSESDGEKVCLLVRSKERNFLFDRVSLGVSNAARAAEIGGIMLAAFALHRASLAYISTVLEDITILDDTDALNRLRAEKWALLHHPEKLFNLFSNWQNLVTSYEGRTGHPLVDLNKLVNEFVTDGSIC